MKAENLETFRVHLASRKFKPEPLRTGKIPLKLPPDFTSGKGTVMLEPCRVLSVDFGASREALILELTPKCTEWLYNLEKQNVENAQRRGDVRLSRFKRAFGGMMNPPLRTWTKALQRTDARISPGAVVQCGITPRFSKGKAYFDLHRDIVVHEAGKIKKAQYFSDGDDSE
tara:strand:- start:4390 stop:4902 length:513 start_codon:yes stop_codon:yes gene_type:complete